VTPDPTRDEPRCPKCGYILFGLGEPRCPECGSSFDPVLVKDAAVRAHLLPWERPELGGRIRRFSQTLFLAWFHPGRMFASLAERKDRPVRHPISFIAACVGLAIVIHVVAMILERATFFLVLWWERGHFWSAYDTVVKTFQAAAWSYVLAPLVRPCGVVLALFVIALLLKLAFGRRLVSLRTRDFLAVFAPALTFGALAWGLAHCINASLKHQAGFVVGLGLWAQTVIVLTFAWFCCRKLLSFNRRQAAAITLLCGLLEHLFQEASLRTLLWVWALVG